MDATYRTRLELQQELDRLDLPVPLAENTDGLVRSFRLGTREVPNRLCALPMMGEDAEPDGSPSAYTVRRYLRYAQHGFGMIWFEATTLAPGATASGQLCLQDGTLAGFTRCVDALRTSAPGSLLILQLWPSDGLCVPDYVAAAHLAARAGFDGVDIACCHGNRLSALLSTPDDSLPNRAQSLRKIVRSVRAACPELVVAVRLDAYQARAGGFGVDGRDYRQMDLAEPLTLARWLRDDGVEMMSLVANSPNLFGDPSRRPNEPVTDAATPHEHLLTVLARHQEISRQFREGVPGLVIVGAGYSRLGRYAPNVAAGAIKNGSADIIGFGRLAILDPRSPGMCSLLPFAESDLWEEGEPFGLRPARDPPYRDERMAVFDQICALGGDAGMLVAFQQGRIEDAYRILRRDNPLPEMSSHIRSNVWLSGRENLRQLQYMIAWTARNMGITGVRVPVVKSGKRIAVIGGGPTGLSATVRLLELGHQVSLLEREDRLGGAPALVYPEDRSPDPAAEIEALLKPALRSGGLAVTVGYAASAEQCLADHDAVLVATGCWNEPSLGTARGVWPALRFLKAVRSGECTRVSPRVAVLCGGDTAMDAAVTAKTLGAERVELIFDCPRQEVHWHLPRAWFDTEGVHARFGTHPVGYCSDAAGHVRGITLERDERIDADMVIEAMGLGADPVNAVSGNVFAAGACVNGGASVEHCIREGFRIAETINQCLRRGLS